MAIQKKVDLNDPLDASAKPTLKKTALTPEYSEAALTLHGDIYKQLQNKARQHVFWHPSSLVVMVVGFVGILVYRLYDYIVVADSVIEFLGYFVSRRDFQFQVISAFPIFMTIFMGYSMIAYFVSDDFVSISKDLPNHAEKLFGFELKKFAALRTDNNSKNLTPKESKLLKNGENSNLIIYRDSPIAVCTLEPLVDSSTLTNFNVKISGLHVRKVFAKVDFESLLLDWAILRSRMLFQDFTNGKLNVDGCKINLLIDAYSFDKRFVDILRARSFKLVGESYRLNTFSDKPNNALITLLLRGFGIKRQTYVLTLVTKNGDEDILLKTSEESSYMKKDNSTKNKIRKRK